MANYIYTIVNDTDITNKISLLTQRINIDIEITGTLNTITYDNVNKILNIEFVSSLTKQELIVLGKLVKVCIEEYMPNIDIQVQQKNFIRRDTSQSNIVPTINHDIKSYYVPGSTVITNTSDVYMCLDNTKDNAIWKNLSEVGPTGPQGPQGLQGELGPTGAGYSSESVAVLVDQKTSGTNGGAFFNGAWRTRDLNTFIGTQPSWITLNNNQFTLDPGTYSLESRAPAFRVNNHQTRLQDVTTPSTIALGSSELAKSSSNSQTSPSFISAKFTIGTSTTFEIQHQCQDSRAPPPLTNFDGYGVATGFGPEIYTALIIVKFA